MRRRSPRVVKRRPPVARKPVADSKGGGVPQSFSPPRPVPSRPPRPVHHVLRPRADLRTGGPKLVRGPLHSARRGSTTPVAPHGGSAGGCATARRPVPARDGMLSPRCGHDANALVVFLCSGDILFSSRSPPPSCSRGGAHSHGTRGARERPTVRASEEPRLPTRGFTVFRVGFKEGPGGCGGVL